MSDETPSAPEIPEEVWATFSGPIDCLNAGQIAQAVNMACTQGVKKLHIAIQTFGGFVGDSVFLYNLFRESTTEIIAYNMGSVASAGVTAYVGAHERVVAPYSTFMLHHSTRTGENFTPAKLKFAAENALIENQKSLDIYASSFQLDDTMRLAMTLGDLVLTAERAVEIGLAHRMGAFAPPPGSTRFTIKSIPES